MFSRMVRPTVPVRSVAPIMATESGRNKASSPDLISCLATLTVSSPLLRMSPRSLPEYQRSAKSTCKRTNPLGSVILITQLSEGRRCPEVQI